MKSKNILLLVLILIVLVGTAKYLGYIPDLQAIQNKKVVDSKVPMLTLPSGKIVSLDIAQTEAEKEKGLSGINSYSDNKAMIFTFAEPAIYPFWMENMMFPLDIFWLDQNFKVITLYENVSPDTYPNTFESGTPAKYVVEANAGFALKNNIVVNSVLKITNLPIIK